jgi:hypothetical protein
MRRSCDVYRTVRIRCQESHCKAASTLRPSNSKVRRMFKASVTYRLSLSMVALSIDASRAKFNLFFSITTPMITAKTIAVSLGAETRAIGLSAQMTSEMADSCMPAAPANRCAPCYPRMHAARGEPCTQLPPGRREDVGHIGPGGPHFRHAATPAELAAEGFGLLNTSCTPERRGRAGRSCRIPPWKIRAAGSRWARPSPLC